MTDPRAAAALGVVLVLCLGGCASTGPDGALPTVPVPPGPTVPLTPGQTLEVLPPPPPVRWSDDGEHLAVTTTGSSSCPSGPTDVTVLGDQEVGIEIGFLFPDRDPCTADMAPTTTEVERPRGIDPAETVTVRLGYEGGGEETVVVLPPAGD